MAYAIVCDARKGADLGISHLALVDRRKSRELWWTSDDSNLILKFESKLKAQQRLRRLKHNNPQILDYNMAVEWIEDQEREILEMTEGDPSWDAHKEAN